MMAALVSPPVAVGLLVVAGLCVVGIVLVVLPRRCTATHPGCPHPAGGERCVRHHNPERNPQYHWTRKVDGISYSWRSGVAARSDD